MRLRRPEADGSRWYSVRGLARELTLRACNSRIYLLGSFLLDLFAQTVFRPTDPSDCKYHLLVTTVGGGNIGDQAMFEAFVSRAGAPVVAIVEHADSFIVPTDLAGSVETVPIDRLLSGVPLRRLRARRRYLELLSGARTLSILGADVMDGGYWRRDSVLRSHLLEIAVRRDVPCQIIGFSLNASPDDTAVRWIRRASARARLNLRDPLSYERGSVFGFQNRVRVADIVFSDDRLDELPLGLASWVGAEAREGRPFIVLNTSGLIDNAVNLVQDYITVVDGALARGWSVLLLPHVIRPGDNDCVPAASVVKSVGNDHVLFWGTLLSPRQVRMLVSDALFVVSGRMHLAVIALGAGTPSVVLATQGKVEGLMRDVGTPNHVVKPVGGFSGRVLHVIDEWVSGGDRRELEDRVREVRRLSERNFELTRGSGDGQTIYGGLGFQRCNSDQEDHFN